MIRFRERMIERFSYNTTWFPWRERVNQLLAGVPFVAGDGDHHHACQGSSWHRAFYSLWPSLRHFYLDFIHWMAGEFGLAGVVHQTTPTFRVHPVGSVAVGEWHRDSDYGHVPGEYNVWLPLMDAFGTNTIWIEGEPQDVKYGDALIFDGVNLLHGNKQNTTPDIRTSLDFRIAGFQPSESMSANAGKRLAIGDYFEELDYLPCARQD